MQVGGWPARPQDRRRAQKDHPRPGSLPAELQERIIASLDGPEAKILRALIAIYPGSVSREELGQGLGYTNTRSGGFSEPLGKLIRLGLAEAPERGRVRATALLFLD